jgi:hypothetical protein
MIDLLEIEPNIIDPSLQGKIFWFYGEPSTRKTSIAAKFPSPIFFATEKGYKFINGVKAANINNWNEVRQLYRQLRDPRVRELYKTVVFDRADTLYDYCKQYICAIKGISDLGELAYSAGYTAAKKEFNSIIKGIESLGYGMVFITHDKVDMEKQTKQDLENNAAKVLKGYADFIFWLRKEVVDDQNTVIAYSQTTGTDSKSRIRYFAPSFEFTYENLEKELDSAVKRLVAMDGIETRVQEYVEEKQRTFEEVQKSVIQLYTHFVEISHSAVRDIEAVIITQMDGIPISQAPTSYYNKLLTIEAFMLSIEE